MKKAKIKFLVCCLLFLNLMPSLFARKINIEKREHVSINGEYEYFEDKNGEFTIETIQNQKFIPSKRESPSFGLTNSVYWIRFSEQLPHTDLDLFKLELNNTLIEDICLYTSDNDGSFTVQKSGRVIPFKDRNYPLKSFVFDLPNDGKTHFYYLRVKSLYTMAFPIEFARYSAITEIENDRQLLFGFIFGLIFLVALYNSLMYAYVKEKVYLIYALYAFIFGFYNAIFVGLDVQYLYPDLIDWPHISASVFAGLSSALGCLLSMVFLSTKTHAKTLHKILLGFVIFSLILAVYPFFDINILYKKIITLFPIIIFIPTIWAAVVRMKQGFFPATLFLFGWGCLGIGILCYGLRSTQVLESNLLSAHAIPIGTVIEMLFLSASLTYKFKLIKDENESAKEEKIRHLEELRALKEKANKELEIKVIERTKEVIKQKDELALKNKHITDSINYAKRLQDSLLPNQEQIRNLFQDCFVLYQPKDIVSGDFYWLYKGDKYNFLVVADCTGHGVPGAIMSILGHTYLDEVVREIEQIETGELLEILHHKLNHALSHNSENYQLNDGMDVSVLRFDIETNEVMFSAAKRPLWIINDSNVKVIKGSRFPIGGFHYGENYTYETHVFHPKKGDCWYLFTDGYPDQFGEINQSKLMTKKFREVLLSMSNKDMQTQKEKLLSFFNSWKGDLEQTDDILVLGIKF